MLHVQGVVKFASVVKMGLVHVGIRLFGES